MLTSPSSALALSVSPLAVNTHRRGEKMLPSRFALLLFATLALLREGEVGGGGGGGGSSDQTAFFVLV